MAIWAGGIGSRGYAQNKYNFDPNKFNYNKATNRVTYGGEDIGGDYKGFLDKGTGRFMLNSDADLKALQGGIDAMAQNSGIAYASPKQPVSSPSAQTQTPSTQAQIPAYTPQAIQQYQGYNPQNDVALQKAMEGYRMRGMTAANQALSNQLQTSGGYGSSAAQIASQQALQNYQRQAESELLPKYAQMDYDRFLNERNFNVAQDKQDYERFLTQREYADTIAQRNKTEQEKLEQKEIDTLGQYYGDYQKEINRRMGTPDTADDKMIPYLKMLREKKIQDMENKKLAQDKLTAEKDQQAFENKLEKEKLVIENAYKRGQLSAEQARIAIARAEMDWKKDPTNPDNIKKVESADKEQEKKVKESKIVTIIDAQKDKPAYIKANKSNIVNEFGLDFYRKIAEDFGVYE